MYDTLAVDGGVEGGREGGCGGPDTCAFSDARPATLCFADAAINSRSLCRGASRGLRKAGGGGRCGGQPARRGGGGRFIAATMRGGAHKGSWMMELQLTAQRERPQSDFTNHRPRTSATFCRVDVSHSSRVIWNHRNRLFVTGHRAPGTGLSSSSPLSFKEGTLTRLLQYAGHWVT